MGQVEIWEVENLAEMALPPARHVNVPQAATVRFAARFGAPGQWMYHCHILGHAELGMMGEFEVAPRARVFEWSVQALQDRLHL